MIEIVMVVIAWRKGWKGYALLPMLLSFMGGIAAGALDAFWVVLIAEVAAITTLGIMIAHPPQANKPLITVQ